MPDGFPGETSLARATKRVSDLVNNWVAGRVTKNALCRCLAISPNRKTSFKVTGVYLPSTIQERVDHREPYCLRFGSGGYRAKHSWPVCRQLTVGLDPQRACLFGHGDTEFIGDAGHHALEALS